MSRSDRAREANEAGCWALWVPGPLPGLNELLQARGERWVNGGNNYNAIKRGWSGRIASRAREQRCRPVCGGRFVWEFYEPDTCRDPSNIMAGAVKIIEDALVRALLLEDDGWGNVASVSTGFYVEKSEPGVFLTIELPVFWERTEIDERKCKLERVRRDFERRKARALAAVGARPRARRA